MRGFVLLLASLLLGPAAPSAVAQEGPSLGEVESLMAQGRIMEARETLENWWTTRFSLASRMAKQRGIWLRGKLTVDPTMAELDFRRLLLEFPGGPYTDDALVRLGLSAELRGELREAQASFQTLVRSYPSSPRLPEAERWLRDHADAIAALPEPSPSVSTAPPPEEERRGTEGPGDFTVQLGAFRSLERALYLAGRLRDVGYRPRVVRTPGSELARVRVGRFTTRDECEAAAQRLRDRGFDVTLATDAGSEEEVGQSAERTLSMRLLTSSARWSMSFLPVTPSWTLGSSTPITEVPSSSPS